MAPQSQEGGVQKRLIVVQGRNPVQTPLGAATRKFMGTINTSGYHLIAIVYHKRHFNATSVHPRTMRLTESTAFIVGSLIFGGGGGGVFLELGF